MVQGDIAYAEEGESAKSLSRMVRVDLSIEPLQASVNTQGNSFGNPHGGIPSLESGLRMSDLYHSRLFRKEASDRVFTEKPKPGELGDCVMSFKSWNAHG